MVLRRRARVGDIDEVKLASCGLTGNAADVRVAQGGSFDKASAYARRSIGPSCDIYQSFGVSGTSGVPGNLRVGKGRDFMAIHASKFMILS